MRVGGWGLRVPSVLRVGRVRRFELEVRVDAGAAAGQIQHRPEIEGQIATAPHGTADVLVEMGENRTPRPEHGCRELPTGISGQLAFRDAGPRPAGCFACYPVMPLGSLTPLTGVGDAAPPLMTSSPSGEDGRRQCSLPKQRGRNYRCQLQQLPAFLRGLRATSTCDSRFPGAVET